MVRCPPSIWQWSASTPLSPASASLPASVRSSSSSSSCPAAAPEQRRADAKESEEDELTSVAEERASRIKGRDAAVNRLPSSSSCSSCSSCFSPLHLYSLFLSSFQSILPPILLISSLSSCSSYSSAIPSAPNLISSFLLSSPILPLYPPSLLFFVHRFARLLLLPILL